MKSHQNTFQYKFREPAEPVGKVAELFAGVGGFRLGLAASGWQTVFSNQWEPSTKRQHASEVYTARFGETGHSDVDIAQVDEIPVPFDLLVGGFPCQDYSVAKSASAATGLEGKKGVLWWEILRLVNLHRPGQIFLENVDRLLKSPTAQRGRDFGVMLSSLAREGYLVEWRVLNAADYGFPQRRIRVFIVATRLDDSKHQASPENLIFETGVFPSAFPVVANNTGVIEIGVGQDPAEVSKGFNPYSKKTPFMNAGVFLNGSAFTARVDAHFEGPSGTLRDVLIPEEEVPEAYRIPPENLPQWAYLKGAKSIPRVHKSSGTSYFYSEGKMTFPDSLDRPARTILTGEGGSTPSRFKHVLQVEGSFRRLTPTELERLAGFPDGWTALGDEITDARRAFFIGNSLVVGVVDRVGEVLASRLKRPSS